VSETWARTELDGGLTILTEAMPGLRSASLGIWVRAGSVSEGRQDMGVSHLLEHMVFKGTAQRSAREIALVLERLGGSLDAYTTREHTSYQARVLDSDLDIALDVLADLVLAPALREADLELEREVVLEEIAQVEDTPDDLVFDLHAALLWGDHPYGYSILGTRETVTALTADALQAAHAREYRRGNVVVAAAGNVEHAAIVERVAALFDAAGQGTGSNGACVPKAPPPRTERLVRDSAQTHLVFGAPTFGHADPRRYALVLLSTALGGGMSSRLFQRIREELGLAYAVYSHHGFHRHAGMLGVYAGTRPDGADRTEEVLREELARVARDGLTADELEDAKGQVKGQLVLSLESSSTRLHRLAGTALYGEPFRTAEEVMQCVEAVTLDETAAIAAEYLAPDRQTVLRLGPDA
jgi:predicted Zn-dependent peptidase